MKFFVFWMFIILALSSVNSKTKCKKRDGLKKIVRHLRFEIKQLKDEIEALKSKIATIPAGPVGRPGPKGDPGIIGPPGFRGEKGERGATGYYGGRKGAAIPNLPSCGNDEFLSSNGKQIFCVKFAVMEQMTTFERKSMLQSFHGDTWDIGVIHHDANLYYCSSLLGKAFSIHKWISTRFWEVKSFPIRDARNWKSFTIGGSLYLAVASNSNNNSPIYKFISSEVVEEYQQIPVKGVFDVEPFQTKDGLFLVYTSIHGPSSAIFRWNKVKKIFVKHQIVNAYGTDVEVFTIDGSHFLAFVAMEGGPYINLYKLAKDGNFSKYGAIRDNQRAYSMHHLQINDDHFLAVAKYSNQPSIIFKWDGKTFRSHQQIASCWARGFTSITSSLIGQSETYLAVVNNKCNPAIYVWRSDNFIKVQEMESKLTRDMDFFPMNNHVYLVVSAVQNTNIYRGTVKKQN
eukprot:gene9110-10083_t